MLLGITLLAVAGATLWLIRRPPGRASARPADDIDHEVLNQAEAEVRDLDASTTPDEAADHLPDWGPGAPKP